MTLPAPALLATLIGLYAMLFGGALVDSLGAVVLASIGLYLIEAAMQRMSDRRLPTILDSLGADVALRFLLRLLLVVVFLLRSARLSGRTEAVVVAAVGLHQLLRLVLLGLTVFIAARRRRRAETRNITVRGDQLPPPPPGFLVDHGERVLLHTDLFLLAGLCWALVTGSARLIAPGAVAMALAAAVPAALLVPQTWRLRAVLGGGRQVDAVAAAVRRLEPLVVLYFGSGPEDVYQVNAWLRTMELLDRPVLILLRGRLSIDSLAETTLPVVCLPRAVDVINFLLPSARVSLFVSNVGPNIHLLREPDLMSAFIGHGDSDKTASFNPFTKVYDEVWVAGEAGRDRYRRADVGVRDEQVVVVGRPQLDGLRQQGHGGETALFTVLYAPTWEGWTKDPHHSSIATMGRDIVRVLLATEGVRVIFKPHPLTGSVDPAAARARADIEALLVAAGSPHAAVLDGAATLYGCFDQADALVSDVSSVVSDFLAAEKPYFVTNGADLPDADFRDRYASAAAAHLVGPAAAGLAAGLADARGPDALRALRAEVRAYLLGSPDVPSLNRFRDAVDSLAARARRGHAHESQLDAAAGAALEQVGG